MTPTRDQAWQLVEEWIESDSLRKHLLGVEAATALELLTQEPSPDVRRRATVLLRKIQE